MKKGMMCLAILGSMIILLGGCSKNQTSQPSKSHPEGWARGSGDNSHAAKVVASGMVSCTSCHGQDFRGGDSKVSCLKCHGSYPHPDGWIKLNAGQFHGNYLRQASYSMKECQACHGQNLKAERGGKICEDCHVTHFVESQWNAVGDDNFHGAYLKSGMADLDKCRTCHGDDLKGGTSQSSCYTCHGTYPHSDDFANNGNSPEFHGAFLKAVDYKTNACTSCHGADLQGGSSGVSCTSCHEAYPHSASFKADKNSAQFHGPYLKANDYEVAACSPCHGSDYQGGSSGKTCFKCHGSYPHSPTWLNKEDARSHIGYLRGHRHDLQDCQACHGDNYQGGTSGASCYVCHNSAQGPENCTLCHGSSDNMAPPRDTQGNTSETALGVGRHQFHVADKKYTCLLCHAVPASFAAPGHVYQDTTPGHAEVSSLWQWNSATATCVTGCHENNPAKNFVWNH